MKLKEILTALLEEQKKTNELMERIMSITLEQNNTVASRGGQAEMIMGQVMQMLNKYSGGSNGRQLLYAVGR